MAGGASASPPAPGGARGGLDASAPTVARDGQARPAEGVEATRDSPFPTAASTPRLSVDSKRGPTGGDGGMEGGCVIMTRMDSLTDPGALEPFLARHGLSARKGLGQHFLRSAKVVEKILARVDGMAGVLEIGPGPGILTAPISQRVERVIAVEIDPRMVAALAESAPNAEVRLLDALRAPLGPLLSELPAPRAVVSNLPYYITGPLLDRIAGASDRWSRAVLMMQREVGRRILAEPGDSERGALSVSLQASFEIERVCDVPPGAFLPPPKVESLVLQLTPKPSTLPPGLLDFVRAGFRQPRKTLANNLVRPGLDRDAILAALENAGLDARVRPHALTHAEWVALHRILGVS